MDHGWNDWVVGAGSWIMFLLGAALMIYSNGRASTSYTKSRRNTHAQNFYIGLVLVAGAFVIMNVHAFN